MRIDDDEMMMIIEMMIIKVLNLVKCMQSEK